MRSRFVVIAKITFQYPTQMLLVEHNHVIQALATYASNHPLGVWILTWALCSSPHFLNAHSPNSFLKVFTIDAITISEKITCRFILRKRFDHLLRGPFRSRMGCHVEVPAIMDEHNEDKQNFKPHGVHGEEVDRSQL